MRKIFFVVLFALFSALGHAQNMHPVFFLLDAQGKNVLESGNPISTMETCGNCHDTEYISSHSLHSSVGLDQITPPGTTASGRAWDISPGLFGRWNPLVYRLLSPLEDFDTKSEQRPDLTTPDWIQTFGARHAGGGPASVQRHDQDHSLLDTQHPAETTVLDSKDGRLESWDWQSSGVSEMNCFLCHFAQPAHGAYSSALAQGLFAWANTATLEKSGLVIPKGNQWNYEPSAFDQQGKLKQEWVQLQDPSNDHCGQCHGLVHDELQDPLFAGPCQPDHWTTVVTGQIVSPQRISASGLNLKNKKDLVRAWDVHAERLVDCVDCHHSINNPVYYRESVQSRPSHLSFSPRRMDISTYLYRPNHQFARGQSSFQDLEPEFQGTMRRCVSCHDFDKAHPWLPYRIRHQNSLTCESCHIPKLYSPARRVVDWTILLPNGMPRTECRGIDRKTDNVDELIYGYEPLLLPRHEKDGRVRFAPYNLITTWFWTYGSPPRPVRLVDLKQALFDHKEFKPAIGQTLDSNQNGQVEEDECILDTPQKQASVRQALEKLGLTDVRIQSEIQPYGIHHNVTHGEWVTRECESCHHGNSLLNRSFLIARSFPDGSLPEMVSDSPVVEGAGFFVQQEQLFFKADSRQAGFYILGLDSVLWVQIVGAGVLVLVLFGIAVHGGLRIRVSRNHQKRTGKTRRVYMYTVYERSWHWLQAFAIIGLIFTGLIIHAPDVFGFISFGVSVWLHNLLAFILLVNAFLALFYHFASGAIKKFVPEPHGFFNQAIDQALYYVKGIFKNAPHPFEKNPDKKLNPLQKITYLVILNVLLPLQIVSGILIWGAQHWPQVAKAMGGLQVLVPLHSLVAWFFAAFIIMHIYLTTTGHTPTSSIKAMIGGWEDVEKH